MENILNICSKSKEASTVLSQASTKVKNECLKNMIFYLKQDKDYIIAENKKDIDIAIKKGIPDPMIDRLELNEKRLVSVIEGIE